MKRQLNFVISVDVREGKKEKLASSSAQDLHRGVLSRKKEGRPQHWTRGLNGLFDPDQVINLLEISCSMEAIMIRSEEIPPLKSVSLSRLKP